MLIFSDSIVIVDVDVDEEVLVSYSAHNTGIYLGRYPLKKFHRFSMTLPANDILASGGLNKSQGSEICPGATEHAPAVPQKAKKTQSEKSSKSSQSHGVTFNRRTW
ncbi:hypothetical protein L1887_13934 [Cichorium endivia]|nr:hypothetical protein L1887_13934 [Cichorium endivia]